MLVPITDPNRIQEWKDCLDGSADFSEQTKAAMKYDYLHEIWVIQEINGDLPEEFKGLQ